VSADGRAVVDDLRRLTAWAASVRLESLPQPVLRRGAVILADDFGAIVAARDEPQIACFHDRVLARPAMAEATVFRGGRVRTDRVWAAAANAVAACWLELDEGYRPVPCHAGLHVLPALMAEAEAVCLPVQEVLRCLVLAYEIVTRVARCWNAPALVMHTHAQYCALGAAMGVGLARGLDAAALFEVLSMAATFVNAGPRNHALSGAYVRNAWPAAGAINGMMSVTLQSCGFNGRADALVDVYGGILHCPTRPEELTADLGVRWAVQDGYTKPYACCQHTHSAVEAALALHRDLPATAAPEIETLTVQTHELATRLLNRQPHTTLAARFSLPHVVASALLRGDMGATACDEATLRDPAIAALRERIEVQLLTPALPPPCDRATRISLVLRDQTSWQSECLSATGSPDHPLPEVAFDAKLRAATASAYPQALTTLEGLMALSPEILRMGFDEVVALLCMGSQ